MLEMLQELRAVTHGSGLESVHTLVREAGALLRTLSSFLQGRQAIACAALAHRTRLAQAATPEAHHNADGDAMETNEGNGLEEEEEKEGKEEDEGKDGKEGQEEEEEEQETRPVDLSGASEALVEYEEGTRRWLDGAEGSEVDRPMESCGSIEPPTAKVAGAYAAVLDVLRQVGGVGV